MKPRNAIPLILMILMVFPAFAHAQGDDWTFHAPPLSDQSAERLRSAFISIVPNGVKWSGGIP